MTSPRQPYLRWVDEEIEGPAGSRLVRVAWLAQTTPSVAGRASWPTWVTGPWSRPT